MMTLSGDVAAASTHRPVALATGQASDLFLCRPFLEHPRFMAQPPLYPSDNFLLGPYVLLVTDAEPSPVGATIRTALHHP